MAVEESVGMTHAADTDGRRYNETTDCSTGIYFNLRTYLHSGVFLSETLEESVPRLSDKNAEKQDSTYEMLY